MAQNAFMVPQADAALPTSPASLAPWQLAYTEWLAQQDRVPGADVRLAKAIEFRVAQGIPEPFTDVDLRAMHASRAFKAYAEKMRSDALRRCRARIEARLDTYIEAHSWALDQAKRTGDYRAVASISEPMVERVWPRKSENASAAGITIVLMPAQQAAVHAIDKPVEVLEADIVGIEPERD